MCSLGLLDVLQEYDCGGLGRNALSSRPFRRLTRVSRHKCLRYDPVVEMLVSSATDHTRHYRRSLFFILALGVFLSGYMSEPPIAAISGTPAAAQFTFEQYEFVTGSAKRQTVLTGFLLGGAVAELAVLNIDENDERRLRIYAFGDGAWAPRLEATLRPEVLFVDVANIGGRDRLVTYERGRLNWFDPESATERALVAVTSNFSPPRRGEIPHVDLTRDVNADDRDDLVVPDFDGFWVFIQMEGGAFADPVKIGPSTEMGRILGADGYRYDPWSQSRVHEVDYNQDGRSDLVFWSEDHFEVHHQDERGLFAPVAETFTTDVAFDSDELSSLASGDMTGKVLHSFTDLNGDGVADLVVFNLEGRRIASKRSIYEMHFGAPTPDGHTKFAREIDTAIQSDGIQLAMDRHDFDRDGQVDMMFKSIEVGFLKNNLYRRFRGFMGGEIKLDLEFYRMEGGLYADKPNATRRINLQYPGAHRGPGWVPLDLAARGKSPAGLVVSAVGPDARCADRGDAGTSSRRRYTADGPTAPQPEGRPRFAAAGPRYSSSPMSRHRLLLVPCQQPQIPGARLHATFTTGC